MASFLINARPYTGRLDVPKGGVYEQRAGAIDFGAKEVLPKLIRVHCPPALMSDLAIYTAPWRPLLQVEELTGSVDLIADTHRYRVQHSETSSSVQNVDFGKLQRSIIEPILASWNAEIVSDVNGVIEFNINIKALVSCPAVLDWPQSIVDAVVFDEVDYNPDTGLHIIDIDYSATNKGSTAIEEQAMKSAQVLAHSASTKVIRIAVPRDIAKTSFVAALQDRYESVPVLYLRRYYLPETMVDQIIAEGGERTYEALADLQAAFVDRLA